MLQAASRSEPWEASTSRHPIGKPTGPDAPVRHASEASGETSFESGRGLDFGIESDEFLPSISGATDTPFLSGNRIDILSNGDEIYPPMLEAIRDARGAITIEAYIYWGGDIGLRFAEALAAQSQSGVRVKILLDAVGSSNIGSEILETLKSGGCQVEWYHRVFWYTIDRINNRTHRKSLIIDGRVGFTGGAGIADHWLGHAEDEDHWRDTQIRIEGPAVTTLQAAFSKNWLETTGELITGSKYFPKHEAAGHLDAMSILSSPETGSSTVRTMYIHSILCARKSIWIANPYFVPDRQALAALVEARRRGVDVKVMVAGDHNDNLLARLNSVRLYGELLDAGAEIYEYDRTMMHHKYMVCDGVWSTVGTSNFDNRSFALNDENNVCVYDRGFASVWEKAFRTDQEACSRVDLEEWRSRGLVRRSCELVAAILRSQV